MSSTAQTDRQRGRNIHYCPPSYSPPLSACSGPDPLGDHCCSSHIGQQTVENPFGLPLTFPPTDRSGPDRRFRRGIAGPNVRRPQCQTCGLELAADHETGETPTSLRRRELLSDLRTGNHNYQSIQPLRNSGCLGHRGSEGTPVPGVSDFVLYIKLGPPPGTH